MEPLYSILLSNQSYSDYRDRIKTWLSKGIKVIWFTRKSDEVAELKNEYSEYTQIYLLQAYYVEFEDSACIVDGHDSEGFVNSVLEFGCPQFNSAQYQVEHCNSDEHIIVQASAGTGKTTVMIDRILFLLHTQPDLHLPEVYMVTFTRDATDQMNRRLQDVLTARYKLTREKKYLAWLEEQSQMNISTLHSFAYEMLKEYGIGEGFTKNLAIRSFKYEKKEIIKDALDEKVDDTKSIKEQLGIPFYRANDLLNQYWGSFLKLGVSHAELLKMDWGEPNDKDSESFHNIIADVIPKIDDSYFDVKRRNDGVDLDDMMRDLQEVLSSDYLPKPDISMKYLFIDEFQDSDLSQIMVACFLIKLLGAALFVVGDVKQSIYRFRGANDQSFDILHQYMSEMEIKEAITFELVNNYRTSAAVLNKMDKYFKTWGKMDLLRYEKSVIPFNSFDGICKMLYADDKSGNFDKRIAEIARERREDLISRVKKGDVKVNEKARVVILGRTHKEVHSCVSILRRNRIPVTVNEEGSFYSSETVRDFFAMISSFMFPDEPKYIFNYLLTPYAGEIESMNVNDMEMLHGDYDDLVDYLDHFLNQTNWKNYYKDMRLKPVLSVIKQILDDVSVVDNFIINKKKILRDEGWNDKDINSQVYSDAKRYQANLDKLMDIIQRNLGGDKLSIYDLYNFLKLNIATNRDENDAKTESVDDYETVLCMTVHKAKGLEFDTIFIPYTNRTFIMFETTEVLVDPFERKVGWKYAEDKKKRKNIYGEMQNAYYKEMKEKDNLASKQEEMRILYVAMTRSINHFICLVPNPKNRNTWSNMISEVGVDYE